MSYPQYQPQQPQPRKTGKGKKIALGLAGGLVLLFVIAGIAGGGGTNTSSQSVASSPRSAVAPTTTEAKPVQAGPATAVGDGTYQVGTDIVAGRYKTAGPDQSDIIPNCYYARMRDDSGEMNAIIANDNLAGPGSVTIKNGEFIKFSGGCDWTKS